MRFALLLCPFSALSLLLAQPSLAGSLTDKAYQVAGLIGARENGLPPQQKMEINRTLDSLLALLNGDPVNNEPSYVCVSRDNDNTRPFVAAFKDFANLVRIPDAVYNSKQECEQSLANGQSARGLFFTCASKDNDGSRPYKMVGLNRSAQAISLERSALRTLEECHLASRSMRLRPEGVLYCGTRDNDGSRPYAQTGFKFSGDFVQAPEEYRTLEECISQL